MTHVRLLGATARAFRWNSEIMKINRLPQLLPYKSFPLVSERYYSLCDTCFLLFAAALPLKARKFVQSLRAMPKRCSLPLACSSLANENAFVMAFEDGANGATEDETCKSQENASGKSEMQNDALETSEIEISIVLQMRMQTWMMQMNARQFFTLRKINCILRHEKLNERWKLVTA